MAVRFRKSKKILPGVKVNLNKKSASITIGPKWMHHTISTTGRHTTTISAPGTGLSFSETTGPHKVESTTPKISTPTDPQATLTSRNEKPVIALAVLSAAACILAVLLSSIGFAVFFAVLAALMIAGAISIKAAKRRQEQESDDTGVSQP